MEMQLLERWSSSEVCIVNNDITSPDYPVMNNIVLIQSEAYEQLQQSTFAYMRKLMAEEQKSPSVEWLDNDEAATLLKISKRKMQTLRDEGMLGFSQVGRHIYYSREDIDRMLQRHYRKPFRAQA